MLLGLGEIMNPFESVAKMQRKGSGALDSAIQASQTSVSNALAFKQAQEASASLAQQQKLQAQGQQSQFAAQNAPYSGSVSGTGLGTIVSAAYQAGFRGEDLINAAAIAMAESGGNPGAINDSGQDRSVGLFQINQLAHGDRYGTREELMDPYKNAAAAYSLWGSSGGFSPWTTYTGHFTGGSSQAPYLKYLDQARQEVGAFSNRATPGITG